MAGMKITLSAAMRARDVSRPRPEQLTEQQTGTADPDEPPAARGALPAIEGTPQPRSRRRRRRTR
jgi:hypothetical protein